MLFVEEKRIGFFTVQDLLYFVEHKISRVAKDCALSSF